MHLCVFVQASSQHAPLYTYLQGHHPSTCKGIMPTCITVCMHLQGHHPSTCKATIPTCIILCAVNTRASSQHVSLCVQLIRRIDVPVRDIRWSDSGELVALISESSFYILRLDSEAVDSFLASGAEAEDDGLEDAFELLNEVSERVRTGKSCICTFLMTACEC